MTEITRNELALAINMAFDATQETLEALANLPSSVRNSPEVYGQLGLSTGESVTPVIAYILEQTRRENDVAVLAVHTLSSINTPEAENAILEIAHSVLKNEKHPLQKYIGADSIAALAGMGTETAADKIVQLGCKYDVLVHQALVHLGKMYDDNPQVFISQNRQMMEFVAAREVMRRTVSIACDKDDVPVLKEAFKKADDRGIISEESYRLRYENGKRKIRGPVPKDYCSRAFEEALRERDPIEGNLQLGTGGAAPVEQRKLE